MKAEKLRDLDARELEKQSGEMLDQLFHLRLQIGMGQTEGLKKYRVLRKDRARVLTLLAEGKAKASSPPAAAAPMKQPAAARKPAAAKKPAAAAPAKKAAAALPAAAAKAPAKKPAAPAKKPAASRKKEKK